MKSIWLEENQLSLREIPVPGIPAGEALVHVRLAGICATDLELVKGYYPYTGVLGHEFIGEIVDAPGAPGRVGQRVVGEINAVCWQCGACKRGDHTHCMNRTVLGIVNRNGCFAEYLTLPLENLIPVPETVPDEFAVFTEPLAAALEIQQQIKVQPNDRVLVVGAGRLGQLIAQTLALTGCDLQVSARYETQQAMLAQSGIRWVDGSQVQPGSFDLVVEATGSASGFDMARRAVRPRGTIVLKSTYKGDLTVNFSSLVVDEINLIGSRCGPFEPALRLMEMNHIDPTSLIMGRYSIEDGLLGFEKAAMPGVMKILLEFG